MCYKSPGPRCSSHAKNAYIAALQDYKVACKSKNADKILQSKEELTKTENDYYMTPKGQESLREKIAKEGDPNGELDYKLEYGIMAREEAIKEAKIQDIGDVNTHATVNHSENRKVRLDNKFADKVKAEKETLAAENALRKSRGQLPLSKFNNLSLDTPSRGYATYESSLIPEAANLEQVGSVVDSVHGGANTASAIAVSVGIKTSRGGNYYANGANYIGLIQKTESDEGHEYELTENGRAYQASDEQGRAAIMRELVNATPIMEAYIESGKDRAVLEDYIRKSGDGHEESVAKRRASSLISWHDKVNAKNFVGELSKNAHETRERTVFVAAQLKADKEAKAKLSKMPEVKDYGTCTKCYMKLPASGKCNCDD